MVTIERHDGFARLPGDAVSLLEQAVHSNPFLSAPWLAAFERYLVQDDETPVYLLARVAGELRMILPLLCQRYPLLGAARLRSMANFYTGLFDVVAAPAADDDAFGAAVAAAFARRIATEFPCLALLEIAPIRDPRGVCARTIEALRDHGYAHRRFVAHGNWYEGVAGLDFAAYLARRPGQVRSTLERKRQRLARDHGYEIDICTDPEALGRRFPDFHAVYALSWKPTERSPSFISAVMERLARDGLVALGILEVAGEPAAVQLWIRVGASWGVFKLAYDPRFRDLSVGTILTARMIESFFAAGPFAELDFLSGDDSYKKDWMADRREHYGFEAIAGRTLAGRLLRLKRRFAGVALDS